MVAQALFNTTAGIMISLWIELDFRVGVSSSIFTLSSANQLTLHAVIFVIIMLTQKYIQLIMLSAGQKNILSSYMTLKPKN